jgi:parallel beta-helix repeat protein
MVEMKLPQPKKLIKPAIVLGLVLATAALFKYIYNSKFVFELEPLDIPQVPGAIEEFMTVQVPTLQDGPCTDADFQWFDFYSPELKRKVEVKRTGLCTFHYDSLANHSVRIKYGNEDFRLKAAASELAMDVTPFGLFSNMFTEYSIYHILKPYVKYIPKATLVKVNNDESDIRILWDDEFDNSVREEERVDWKALAKVYKFSKDKFKDYFWTTWKTKNEKIDDLEGKFSNLIAPALEYVDKPLIPGIVTDFDEEAYLRYLALATVIGTTHLKDNNILVVADENKKGDILWTPVIYDPGGLYSRKSEPIFTVFRFNYVSELFMRDPANVYEYLTYLDEYVEKILGGEKISKFYDRFECDQVKRSDTFGEILLKANHKQYATNDINGFCNGIENFREYDKRMYQRMNTRIKASSLRWNFYHVAGEQQPILVVWSHTAIPSKLKSIKCGNVDCSSSFELINKPWWDLPKDIIAPEYVRNNGTYAAYDAVSTPYYYMYRWNEKSPLNTETIKLVSENAITGESQESVKALYPIVKVRSQLLEDPKNYYLFETEILGPVNSEYSITEENKNNWRMNVVSVACNLVQSEGARFVFDCSNIDLNAWPYPLDYTISLYYKNAKVRDVYGEMYVNIDVPQMHDYLNNANIEQFSDSGISLDSYFEGVNEQTIYSVPANTAYEVNSDLDLSDATLVLNEGSSLDMWPMTKITVNNLVILGTTEAPVTIKAKDGMPGWLGIEVKNNVYVIGATIKDSVNTENGALFSQDTDTFTIMGATFENNKTNITCSNCNVNIEDVTVTGGTWGLKSSNSYALVNNFSCTETTMCLEVEDNDMLISNLSLENLKAWGINVIGASTDLLIGKNTSAKGVPAILAYRGYPKITRDFNTEGFERVGIIEMQTDNPAMYDALVNADIEALKKEYVNILEQDKSNPQKFYLKKNEVQIDKDLIMPKGTELVINAGTKVNLGSNDSILSYGKISVLGESNNKVKFKSSDKDKKSWGVLAVKGPDAEMYIENAIFENGGDNYLVSNLYTGAVTADHAKSLVVKNSEFISNQGDDGLNCKYTFCTIENNTFRQNAMDGVDFDFAVQGSEIKNNKFENNGNDAIDVSFDKSKIHDNHVQKSGDKCVSVGEGSTSTIYNNKFEGCNIGVEVKDGSNANIIRNDFTGNNIAVNAYMKKRRFKVGGTANVYACTFTGNGKESDQDQYSEVIITDELPAELEGQL